MNCRRLAKQLAEQNLYSRQLTRLQHAIEKNLLDLADILAVAFQHYNARPHLCLAALEIERERGGFSKSAVRLESYTIKVLSVSISVELP